MVRVLHSEISGTVGGIETFLYNIISNIESEEIKFDIITTSQTPAYEEEFTKLGVNIYKIPNPKHVLQYIKALKKIVRENRYDVIHMHKNSLANIIPILIAKNNCKKLIVHSHNTAPSTGKGTVLLHKINRVCLLPSKAIKFACSDNAAKWLFGKNVKDYKVIKNGINVDAYLPDEEKRNKVRKDLGLSREIVIGNVGRFAKQKNNEFMIKTFKEIHQQDDQYKFLLVGAGPTENDIKRLVHELKLDNDVIFLGERKDVCDLLKAMDAFIFPSFYEGLAIAGIEAQCAGVHVFASDTLSRDFNLTGNVEYIPLENGADGWAKRVIDYLQENNTKISKESIKSTVVEHGYDIKSTSSYLEGVYLQKSL